MPPTPPHIRADRNARPRPIVATAHDGTRVALWVTAGGAITVSTLAVDGTEHVASFTEGQTAGILGDVEERRRCVTAA